MRAACPYTCGLCTPSHQTGQTCVRMARILLHIRNPSDARVAHSIDETLQRVWALLIAKAAFEEGDGDAIPISIVLRLQTADYTQQGYIWAIPNSTAVPGTQVGQILTMVEESTYETYMSEKTLSAIWLMITAVVSLVVVAEVAVWTFSSESTAVNLASAAQL